MSHLVWYGLAAGHEMVVTVSDSGRHGGFGSALADALRAAECDVPLRDLALPQEFLEHGNRADVLAAVDAAWERAAELAAQGRELHFSTDKLTGRVIIEVRTLAGEVLRTIPPSRALDVMSGGEL